MDDIIVIIVWNVDGDNHYIDIGRVHADDVRMGDPVIL